MVAPIPSAKRQSDRGMVIWRSVPLSRWAAVLAWFGHRKPSR
jgi:hypothetical protein